MPTWEIEGANRETGQDALFEVEAPSEELARIEASERGIIVATIRQKDVGWIASPGSPRPSPAAAPTMPYAGRMPRQAAIPPYYGLRLGAGAIMISAVLGYILGFALLVLAILSGAAASNARGLPNSSVALTVITVLLPAISTLIGAAVLHGLATGLLALRDIAQNSFLRT